MDNALRMIGDLVRNLTSILVSVCRTWSCCGVAFGDTWFLDDVLTISSLIHRTW